MIRQKYTLWLLFLVILSTCDRFPRDPDHSFQKAQINGLFVGVVENPPFVVRRNDEFSGKEIELIKGFAQKENLNIHFVKGSESQLVEQLETGKLQIISGKFDKKTVWIAQAGLTTPYDKTHVFLIPKGENELLYKLEAYLFEVK